MTHEKSSIDDRLAELWTALRIPLVFLIGMLMGMGAHR